MKLNPQTLSRAAFAAFGDVITTEGATHYPINENTTERFHDLANIDVTADGGRILLSILVGQPRPRPLVIRMMERHPLGSQAFIPLDGRSYLIVVAESGAATSPGLLHAFRAQGTQGINYLRGVWHHPLLVLEPDSRFLLVDRGGPGHNLDEVRLETPVMIDV